MITGIQNNAGVQQPLCNSIGQGEVLTTPIQLANMVATIANRGYFYKPHFVKKIQKDSLKKNIEHQITHHRLYSL